MEEFVERARDNVDFERGADYDFDVKDVPEDFQHLIPFARRWALADCGEQAVFLEHLETHAPEQVQEFLEAVAPHWQNIHVWICDEIETEGAGNCSAAITAFCYLSEMYQLAKPPDPAIIARNRERWRQQESDRQRREDIEQSREAIRNRDFAAVVRLLAQHESQLTGADMKRLVIAKKRVGCDP